MKYKLVLAVLFSALVAPAALAADDIDVSGLMQPGLYEVTAQMSVKGMGDVPPMTRRNCMTEEEMKHFTQHLAEQVKKSNGQVQVKELSLHGKTLHMVFASGQGNLTLDTVFDDPTHYHQTMSGVIAGHAMTGRMTGHRVGECTKAPDQSSG